MTRLTVPALVLLAAAPLAAHGMRLEVRVDASARVVGAAKYGTHAVAQAEVQLLAPDGKVLAEGRTDAEGAFSLAVTQRCDLRVVINDGAHRGEKRLLMSAFPSTLPVYGGGAPPAAPSATPRSADAASLSAVVEAAVARRLEPVELQLQRQADALRLRDILGGIGYILGLAGIGFYFTGRARKQP